MLQKTSSYLTLFIILMLGLTGLYSRPAHADLTITPTRIVFEGRDRSAIVELINTTKRTNTYRLQWMVMKMGSSGRYELQKEDETDPYSVSKMVLFTPRQVTIESNGHQTIRLSLRRPADLPPGEYRAHLAMVRLAKQGPERQDPNPKGVTMDLKVNLGFSIPVIVRSGEDKELKVSIINPKLSMTADTPPSPRLKIDIHRDAGKFSTYGTVKVLWTPPQGSEKEIGGMGNVTLYPELKTRSIDIPLRESPTGGSLRIVYMGKAESDGVIWAEKTFPIGK